MKTKLTLKLFCVCLLSAALSLSVHAQVPGLLNHQGRIAVGTTNFDGGGQFKFALVNSNGTASYWSNDGSSAAGSQPGTAVALTVTKGLYSVLLGDTNLAHMTGAVPASTFTNSDVRLRVWFNDGVNGFQMLTPDQRLGAVGYALAAAGVGNGSITSNNIVAGAVGATQIASNSVTAAKIASGQVVKSLDGLTDAVTLAAGANVTLNTNANTLTLSAASAWNLAGNAGTTPGTNFLGTTDNQPLELRVNGGRALRLEPNTNGGPNVIGGSAGNFVSNGVVGATIGGGGVTNFLGGRYTNSVTGTFGTVGGGRQNTAGGQSAVVAGGEYNNAGGDDAIVGGGDYNIASGQEATVGGGYQNLVSGYEATVGGGYFNTASGQEATVGGGNGNTASGDYTTVGGGFRNTATNQYSMVGGGQNNTASASYATVGGGYNNSATNDYATVSGGENNTASGDGATVGGGENNTASGVAATVSGGGGNAASGAVSFAAGNTAHALHNYSFVWADSAGFSSTANNQFSVRASGGIVLAGDVQLEGGAAYHHLEMSGGNSIGYLYGAYNYDHVDGISLGYNWYADAGGSGHVFNPGGGTSRILAGYGEIRMEVGNIGVAPNALMLLVNTSGVCVNGTVNNCSDRNVKQDFAPVSPSQILDKVVHLPVSKWSYKLDSATRHIGAMAQDFYAAFNVGTDDKHIAPIDEGGVALAAIQGLNQKLTEELKRRDTENAELKQRLDALERIIRSQKSN